MAGRIVAAVVGVPSPETFRFRGKTFAFRTALGVQNDVSWYAALLARRVPRHALDLTVLSSPAQTSVAALRITLAAHAATVDGGDTFLLALVGHGFQARDDNGEEADGFDEVFAAADGAFGDDDFAAIWARLPQQGSLVVIADTCSADSVGLKDLEIRPVDEHVTITASGPWRFVNRGVDGRREGRHGGHTLRPPRRPERLSRTSLGGQHDGASVLSRMVPSGCAVRRDVTAAATSAAALPRSRRVPTEQSALHLTVEQPVSGRAAIRGQTGRAAATATSRAASLRARPQPCVRRPAGRATPA